jgi:nitroreductase
MDVDLRAAARRPCARRESKIMSEARTSQTTPTAAETAATAALEGLLQERHSCRAFLSVPVPRPVIRRILEIAQRTATWCNTQSWHLVITEPVATNQLRAVLYERAKAQVPDGPDMTWPREYRGVYQQRRRDSGFTLYKALGIAREDKDARNRQMLENFRFFGAPHVAIITSDEALGPYGALDCGAYVSNFLLAAQSMGVATIAQAALAQHSAFLRDYLKISTDRLVICGVSFGYADRSHRANSFRIGRASIDEATTWVDH